jgi:Protein of unknown function (DUF993)
VSVAAGTADLRLPRADGGLEPYSLREPEQFEAEGPPPSSRVAFAAAHVVADPLAYDPDGRAVLDWDATLAFRRHLWAHGLGVAEAMDTAQRGTGLDWPAARELIRRSAAEARACDGAIACGASTDHREPSELRSLDAIRAAYEDQCELVQGEGAQPIVMASRALAAVARSPDDYRTVYGAVLAGLERPAILHWLGDMFDPALHGYWDPTRPGDLDAAADVLVSIVAEHAGLVDGVKVSLLDAEREVALRRRLPAGVRLYTGDDFNYPELIAGDGERHSDALLGVFDPIAPAAAAALRALDAGDRERYDALLAPTLPLARRLFEPRTSSYKTGVVFLAYLNGHQEHFRMLGGMESRRSILHLSELFVLADRAGLLREPAPAVARMRHVLALAGIT